MTLMQRVLLLVSTVGNVFAAGIAVVFDSYFLLLLTLSYSVIGLYDVLLNRHTITTLYPVVAHIRFILESFHDEIHQYFVASNTEEKPFNREQRNTVYRRAKRLNDAKAFGTEHDLYEENYLSIEHSIYPVEVTEAAKRHVIGSSSCTKPYSASRLNTSAMSFGSLSANAISALNRAAKIGGYYHNTGEGGISPYHQQGGDLVWQIGSGLFGCRTASGTFDEDKFKEAASKDMVKMIEIKLSQGAKPGHGGVLPKEKITEEIAAVRLIATDEDCVSPARHPFAASPEGLMQNIARLRALSGGKPVGFKLCLGRPVEFVQLVKAMINTQIVPDFITVDGAEGGTGAAPVEFSNRLGYPVAEGIAFVNQVLTGAGLRSEITVIASGKTATGFDVLSKLALGADVVNAARTMMLAMGCIQSQSCHTNHCPTGIATQDPVRSSALDPASKSVRIANFQAATCEHFFELLGAMGLADPAQLKPWMIKRRDGDGNISDCIEPEQLLANGQLLTDDIPERWRQLWSTDVT
ncbi:FMN-binding glutamate synthase family protein [Umboniibacter marinipuniceus]|uniref:Glutamate synthase domain-containing protein 2 n=1 Tax=Umboniibacter marinipuniceus TaxID=569599 RepID=A0A3M0A8Y8_9GAMM|nr:FMN-binding glutamate synthase family protein [Umboniibacter marinipuniceus]RMA79969.1 glutamate synthase domain-containing protein 2 [Umboniibacter marinipuniceus]